MAEQAEAEANDGGRDGDLKPAEAEHEAAHGDEAFQRQLETDQEQEEDDAELGEGREPFFALDGEPAEGRNLAGERSEPVRSENSAGDKKAEHGADLEPLEQRHAQWPPCRARPMTSR